VLYPIPAICQNTTNSILHCHTFFIGIIDVGVFCVPTCFHLGRCSAIGEGEWCVWAAPQGVQSVSIVVLTISNGRQSCNAVAHKSKSANHDSKMYTCDLIRKEKKREQRVRDSRGIRWSAFQAAAESKDLSTVARRCGLLISKFCHRNNIK
jgi:hypothetical protein